MAVQDPAPPVIGVLLEYTYVIVIVLPSSDMVPKPSYVIVPKPPGALSVADGTVTLTPSISQMAVP